MKNKKEKKQIISVGGEALIEGIMMRGPEGAAMSLRMPDGSIETTMKKVRMPKDIFKPLGWPLIRGPVSFIDSMIFGYKCMMESAEKTTLDFEPEENMSKTDKWIIDHLGEKFMTIFGFIAAILGFGIAFLLFFYMPSFVFDLLNKAADKQLSAWKPIVEGLIRITLFVLYMSLVSLMKDIKRVFMYHGAEHKSIFCFENGEELTVENVRKQSRFHPRCGTSFIFVTIILSIFVSVLVRTIFPELADPANRMAWIGVKILNLPVIMSLGYEFIRFAGRHDNVFVKILAAPGMLMQRITTKEPADDIIEVGIAALKAALGIVDEKPDSDDAVVDTERIDGIFESDGTAVDVEIEMLSDVKSEKEDE